MKHLLIPDVLWRPIEGYKNNYIVSNSGKVVSLKATSPKTLSPSITHDGYERVTLSLEGVTKTYRISRLVAKAFVQGYKEGLTVNHKDENKLNNRCSNLEWVTQIENSRYSQCLGWVVSTPLGREIKVLNLHQFCKDSNLDQGTMYNVARGKYKHHKGYVVRRISND